MSASKVVRATVTVERTRDDEVRLVFDRFAQLEEVSDGALYPAYTMDRESAIRLAAALGAAALG